MSIIVIENETLRVSIDRKLGFIDMLEKPLEVAWSHFPDGEPTGTVLMRELLTGQQIRCHLSASKIVQANKDNESSAKIMFKDFVCEEGVAIGGSMTVRVSMDGTIFKYLVEKLEVPSGYALEKIYYPFRNFFLEKSDAGYVTWPQHNGVIVPTNLDSVSGALQKSGLLPKEVSGLSHRSAFTIEKMVGGEGWNFSMPWFGAAKGNSAYMAIVDTPDDASMYITVADPRNKQRLVLSPIWEPSHGEFRYPRSITYIFIGNGNYVSMAKTFRKYAMNKGFFLSLKEKIEANHNVERIIGAPIVKLWLMNRSPWTGCMKETRQGNKLPYMKVLTTYKQVSEILKDMYHNLKIDRALILLAGWGPMGYDSVSPDIWPPGRWQGDFEELREARDIADRQGYLFGLHDNYQDIFVESPSMGNGELVVKSSATGPGGGHKFELGGIWQGGQAFFICSVWGLRYAKRNLPEIMEDLKPTCYFLDTTTGENLHECYDAEHPITRSEDKEYKIKLLKYLNELGLVAGSETAMYWAATCLHYGEGIMFLPYPPVGIPVPLFNLVYHDSVVAYWHQGWPVNLGPTRTKFLLDLLYGNPTSYNFNAETYEEFKDKLREIFKVASSLHRKVALDELVEHRFLTDNYLVQETKFSSGIKVIANFSDEEYVTAEGEVVKPMDYVIKQIRAV